LAEVGRDTRGAAVTRHIYTCIYEEIYIYIYINIYIYIHLSRLRGLKCARFTIARAQNGPGTGEQNINMRHAVAYLRRDSDVGARIRDTHGSHRCDFPRRERRRGRLHFLADPRVGATARSLPRHAILPDFTIILSYDSSPPRTETQRTYVRTHDAESPGILSLSLSLSLLLARERRVVKLCNVLTAGVSFASSYVRSDITSTWNVYRRLALSAERERERERGKMDKQTQEWLTLFMRTLGLNCWTRVLLLLADAEAYFCYLCVRNMGYTERYS
jgi:hypothetical protein